MKTEKAGSSGNIRSGSNSRSVEIGTWIIWFIVSLFKTVHESDVLPSSLRDTAHECVLSIAFCSSRYHPTLLAPPLTICVDQLLMCDFDPNELLPSTFCPTFHSVASC